MGQPRLSPDESGEIRIEDEPTDPDLSCAIRATLRLLEEKKIAALTLRKETKQ